MSERTTTRRRQLGAMMRKLRARKGLTLEEAGQLVGVSKATVSRYETQAGPVKWIVIDALCREYGATDAERKAVVGTETDGVDRIAVPFESAQTVARFYIPQHERIVPASR